MIFVDCEGDPVQEFSAIYVHRESGEIIDTFHRYVNYSSEIDHDKFARRHVHGLCRNYLQQYGLRDESELKLLFEQWLKSHPFSVIFANAPQREQSFLSLNICDVRLKPWKERVNCVSHKVALYMKKNEIPVCETTCHAHKCFIGWRPKKCNVLSETDAAKIPFSFHCSLYDCIESFLFQKLNN